MGATPDGFIGSAERQLSEFLCLKPDRQKTTEYLW